MSELPRYNGEDPVINEVVVLNELDPNIIDVFVELKKEAQEGWGIRENDVVSKNWKQAAEILVTKGFAHWEVRENPQTRDRFRVLILSQN